VSAVLKPDMQFRPMQVSDLDEMMEIENVIYTHPWSRGNFSDSLNAGYSCWILAEDTVIIGYAVLMLAMDEAHLLNLSIAKHRQRQGWGEALLNHILDTARGHGAANIFLEVRISNKSAICLYEKAGFNEMAIRRNYYPAHDGREDAILMGMAL
jgi:ribosomal-protein-alanine N-acetyltransferase